MCEPDHQASASASQGLPALHIIRFMVETCWKSPVSANLPKNNCLIVLDFGEKASSGQDKGSGRYAVRSGGYFSRQRKVAVKFPDHAKWRL